MNCTGWVLVIACLCLNLAAGAEGPKLADGKPRRFSRGIRLADVLNHKWTDELVTYALDFPEKQAALDSIRLCDVAGGKELPFQLSGGAFHDEKRQFVKSATIAFFVDELPANGARTYAVLWDTGAFASALQPAAALKETDMKAETFEATNGLFSVRLAGEKRFEPPAEAATVPGPFRGFKGPDGVFDRQGAVTHCYAKCHLTEMDRAHFTPGNAVALFEIDGILATTVICHERRYPELVRLAVMAGARILFHPNAGMDSLAVSRQKRGGRDGIAARAFENAIYYVFANSVGPQGGGKWSAGDSKIIGPDERVLALADNQGEAVITADLDLAKATGVYARRALTAPPFLAPHWKRIVDAVRSRAVRSSRAYDLPLLGDAPEARTRS